MFQTKVAEKIKKTFFVQ